MPVSKIPGAGISGGSVTVNQSAPDNSLVINSSGNVGIGTNSPSDKVTVSGGNTQVPRNSLIGSSTTGGPIVVGTSGGSQVQFVQNGSNDELAFITHANGVSHAERMRIDSSGRALFGSTDTNPVVNNNAGVAINANNNNSYTAGVIQASASGNPALFLNRGTDDGVTVQFRRSGTSVGSISVSFSGTSYNTSSDYRLKENITSMTGALSKVAQLKPCTYTWKSTGEAGQGFIAHELQAVFPDAVTGEKDAVNEDGSINPQGIDTSFLVATLTAAIQELKAELDATKAEVQALKAGAK